MNEIIENINIIDWQSLIDKFENLDTTNKIFRGQSNSYNSYTKKFEKWPIISSFNRYYPEDKYNFRTIIIQQLNKNEFDSYFKEYKYDKIKSLVDCNQLEKIYFLQHYGIPTCFIDFTKDPLVALYFAMSSVRGNSGRPIGYPDDHYITIYEIDYSQLM